jgi:hypothetical protein
MRRLKIIAGIALMRLSWLDVVARHAPGLWGMGYRLRFGEDLNGKPA